MFLIVLNPVDGGTDVPPVPTPDQKDLGKSRAQGAIAAGGSGHALSVFFSSLAEGMKIIITTLVGAFDELLSLFVGFVTAAQGTGTKGFYDLEAQILNDFIGVEVASDDLAAAAQKRGQIGGMTQAGSDFLNVLLNVFLGQPISARGGPGGLPGTPGTPITPEQGFKGMAAFLGFILSFAVREGNLETVSTAIPASFRMFEGIRSYGRIMAAGLGFGRLAPRMLRPIMQETVIGPMQLKLNQQYRPKVLDPKQIALGHIRGDLDNSDFFARMALQGYTDTDIAILLQDTYTRLSANQIFELHETGQIDDAENLRRMQQLGYNTFDVPLVRQARALELVRAIDRQYITTATSDLHHGLIDLGTFLHDVDSTELTQEEKAAYKRNGANRAASRGRLLTLGFLKKVYLDGAITLDELLAHLQQLAYSQDDIDIIEQEFLIEQAAAAEKKKTAAAKAATKGQTQAQKIAAAIAKAETAEGG